MPTESSPTVTVLYFGPVHDAVQLHSETIPLSTEEHYTKERGFPLSKLGELLISRHPQSGLDKLLAISQWSVDLEMILDVDAIMLQGGEEVTI
jgi:molybdopterin synthase sulfur carrier subunit